MKSIVENLSNTRVKISIEVPFDELKDTFDAIYQRIGSQVRVPGFRPGKVPPRILEARVGRGAVLQEVVNEALPVAYNDAVTSNDLNVLGQPELEVTDISDDKFAFTAEVDTRPEITVPELDSIEATVPDPEVTDEEIDEQVQALRERFSTLKGVERAVESGDFVSLDLRATVGGKDVEGGTAQGLSYEVGTDQLVPGIDEQLIGMNAEETKTFTSKLVAGEHKDQDADVEVTVKSVKLKELPELDDDFASMASEFDTLDELRADLRERLERAKNFGRINQARDAVIDAILEQVSFDMPEGALKAEIDSRAHDAVHAFDHNEDLLNNWIQEQGKTREEFDKELEDDAHRSVRAQLVLDQIVDNEKITVEDDEMTSYLIQQASRYGMAPQQFADEITRAGQVGSLIADVRRNKAVELVLSKATIKDSSGEPLDLNAIRQEALDAMRAMQPETFGAGADDDEFDVDDLDDELEVDDDDDNDDDDNDDDDNDDDDDEDGDEDR